MVFFLKKVHNRIDQLEQNLRNSFERVKQENQNLYAWIKYLNEQSQITQEELVRKSEIISENQHKIRDKEFSEEKVKQIFEDADCFNSVIKRITNIENRIEKLEEKRVIEKTKEFEPVKQTSALKEKVLKRIARNSKDYIKSVVKGIIKKYGKVSALQLREIVVDEQGLCSKSSFYRILEELEAEKIMNLISRGKEKLYVSAQK
ncbi:hypothetical protein KY304_02090 [Candidatus Woesearchaeota archaeon]|nr:hypothetical protein [Candidatus Woesearchaeota archaeon]